jgi:hypothetical protein
MALSNKMNAHMDEKELEMDAGSQGSAENKENELIDSNFKEN